MTHGDVEDEVGESTVDVDAEIAKEHMGLGEQEVLCQGAQELHGIPNHLVSTCAETCLSGTAGSC